MSVIRSTIELGTGAGVWQLLTDPESVQIVTDDSWSPYVQAQVTLTGATAELADPRLGHRLRMTLVDQDDVGNIISTLTILNLSVRDVSVDYVTGSTILHASSGEADVMDRRYMSSSAVIGPSAWAGIREACEDLLSRAGVAPANVDLSGLPFLTSPTLVNPTTIPPGDSWWTYLADFPARIGWQLWCGLDGIWRVSEQIPPAGPSVATVATRVDIEALTRRISRDEQLGAWADGVAAVYEWTDSGGAHRIVGRASTAGVAGNPTKVLAVASSTPVTQAQADARALRLLTTAQARGITYDVTVAGGNFHLRARSLVDLTTPDDVATQVYVSRVTWDLTAGTCTLAVRRP